jgi:sulfhydrogenase subunit beta (sulfur reductase)
MAHKIIAKDQLQGFIAKLASEHQVFAPRWDGGKYVWQGLDKAEDLVWDYPNTDMSPKDFFFPQTECMMRFKNDAADEEGMIMQPEPELAQKRALWGIRACDAKAMSFMDIIFCQDDYTNDVYWRDKRDKTLLIGLACNNPCPSCFCSSVGCGPHDEAGMDIQLVDLGEKLLVKPLSDKAAGLVADLQDASEVDLARSDELKAQAEESMGDGVETDKIADKEVLELFNDPMWDQVWQSCINCGTCTFVCPTCHCFDIQDEVQGDEGRRVRNWDYCMSYLFTLHGMGHNPRPGKKERVRQRFMHKYKYIPMKRDGMIGCTGCGRCVLLCPVNIDIREVANQMNK